MQREKKGGEWKRWEKGHRESVCKERRWRKQARFNHENAKEKWNKITSDEQTKSKQNYKFHRKRPERERERSVAKGDVAWSNHKRQIDVLKKPTQHIQ